MQEPLITVTEGIALTCSFSFPPKKPVGLNVLPVPSRVQVEGKWAANQLDSKPMVNIPTFGQCCAPTHPQMLPPTNSPGPCTLVPSVWSNCSPTVTIGGAPALTMASVCVCQTFFGIISILPGSAKTTKTAVP